MLDAQWTAATHHPFLDQVRQGTISGAAFDRWLVQDARFAADLLAFQARLLARAPRRAQTVLAAGCVGIVQELGWFEVQAGGRGLDLDQERLPAASAYLELLQRLDGVAYQPAVTALWVLEEVYLQGWATAASDSGPFAEYVDHWTTPAFAAYVGALGELAVLEGQEALVAEVLAHEVAFWDMALG